MQQFLEEFQEVAPIYFNEGANLMTSFKRQWLNEASQKKALRRRSGIDDQEHLCDFMRFMFVHVDEWSQCVLDANVRADGNCGAYCLMLALRMQGSMGGGDVEDDILAEIIEAASLSRTRHDREKGAEVVRKAIVQSLEKCICTMQEYQTYAFPNATTIETGAHDPLIISNIVSYHLWYNVIAPEYAKLDARLTKIVYSQSARSRKKAKLEGDPYASCFDVRTKMLRAEIMAHTHFLTMDEMFLGFFQCGIIPVFLVSRGQINVCERNRCLKILDLCIGTTVPSGYDCDEVIPDVVVAEVMHTLNHYRGSHTLKEYVALLAERIYQVPIVSSGSSQTAVLNHNIDSMLRVARFLWNVPPKKLQTWTELMQLFKAKFVKHQFALIIASRDEGTPEHFRPIISMRDGTPTVLVEFLPPTLAMLMISLNYADSCVEV